jgi:hypothetical protein
MKIARWLVSRHARRYRNGHFGRRFSKLTFDVGIAEQHAVTMAASMLPVVQVSLCIYPPSRTVDIAEGTNRTKINH